jgi:hypothetical protein
MPGGFPESPTSVEIKILKKLYTPEESELFIKIKENPSERHGKRDEISSGIKQGWKAGMLGNLFIIRTEVYGFWDRLILC